MGSDVAHTQSSKPINFYLPDRVAVAKVKRRNNLPEKTPGLFRCQSALFNQVIEELAARNMFQNKISLNKGREGQKRNETWMASFKYLYVYINKKQTTRSLLSVQLE